MDISEVRVKLVRDPGERLKAVCIVTFDEAFVVRDVKVVDGTNGLFGRHVSIGQDPARFAGLAKYRHVCRSGRGLRSNPHR